MSDYPCSSCGLCVLGPGKCLEYPCEKVIEWKKANKK